MAEIDRGLELSQPHWEQMRLDVIQHAPEEACGLVAGIHRQSMGIFPVENILHSPVRFRMDPQEQVNTLNLIEQNGWELLAIYHSHPAGPEEPSPTDIAELAYPEAIYLIWYPHGQSWTCKGYTIAEERVDEVGLHIIDKSNSL